MNWLIQEVYDLSCKSVDTAIIRYICDVKGVHYLLVRILRNALPLLVVGGSTLFARSFAYTYPV